jgi:hypothetical protein
LIELLVIDLCVVLLAPEMNVELYISQADKDSLLVYAYADLPRKNLRTALRTKGLLELFDGILYEEIMQQMTSAELRRLANKDKVMWVRTPAELDYCLVLDRLPKRQRVVPKALRLLGQPHLDSDDIFDKGSE